MLDQSKMVALDPGEMCLEDTGETWMRQVRPEWLDESVVSYLAFRCTDADGGKLSGARATKQTARGAYEEREALRPGSSVGTWGLSVGTVLAQRSRCVDDSETDEHLPIGHTYVDYRHLSRSQMGAARLHFAAEAAELYRPSEPATHEAPPPSRS